MRRALALARRGWGQTAPNPMVGAVVVRDGEVVGEGWHRRWGEAHAEVEALRAAGARARGATLYVSLEPCAHVGKTPPCADAVIAAGISRVVGATEDPTTDARGGFAKLRAAGIAVEQGLEAEAARELNAPFFYASHAERPWITLKLALSLDGAIADAGRGGGWLTGPRSLREVHRLRAGSGAVAVGVGTAIADDAQLTVRGVPSPRVAPLRVVFDRTARLPLDAALVRTARESPVVVVVERPQPAQAAALEAAGVELLVAPAIDDALAQLRARGVHSLLVEGGARLAGALLERTLVDRLIIFRAPIVLGAGALGGFAHAPAVAVRGAPRLHEIARRALGDDLMSVYALTPP